MEKRVARTSTKGLTGSLAHNSKKTEILDMVIASGTDLDNEPNFVYLADGSVLLFYRDEVRDNGKDAERRRHGRLGCSVNRSSDRWRCD